MKKNQLCICTIMMSVVLTIVLAGTAFGGGSAEKTSQPQSGNYETIEGVLSIKEGHGDFLVRLSDGGYYAASEGALNEPHWQDLYRGHTKLARYLAGQQVWPA